MEIRRIDDHWNALLDPSWIKTLDESVFLKRCRDGSVTQVELETFMIQHFYYSRHFTRYLCALLSNITIDTDRFDLAENLFEELGLGDVGETPHSEIYRRMLKNLKIDVSSQPVLPSTGELVNTMFFYCKSQDPMDGLGAICLGAEAIVPHVYSQIMQAMIKKGFSRPLLNFFEIHIENDDDHALTMKKIIEREMGTNPLKRARLRRAAADVIEKRRRMFDDISLVGMEMASFTKGEATYAL